MSVKLLTEHHLEFLSLKVGCRGSSESTLVKMSNCWKAHAAAHFILLCLFLSQEKRVRLLFSELSGAEPPKVKTIYIT